MMLSSKTLIAAAVRFRPAVALAPLVFCLAGAVTWAQSAGSSPPTEPQPEPPSARGAHRPRSVTDQLDGLTIQLHLTADQRARVKIILERRRAEILRLRSADSLTAVDRFNKLEAVKRDALEEINGLLTEQQRKIFRPEPSTPHRIN
jgi:hypothetical protein